MFYNNMHFLIFCLIFPSDYLWQAIEKKIYILLNDMHFSDILSDFLSIITVIKGLTFTM